MAVDTTPIHDITTRIRNIVASGVTDPISATRASDSRFVMTSFPNRKAQYPLIIISHENQNTTPLGIGVAASEHVHQLQVSIFARNVKERDELTDSSVDYLRLIQFSGGSVGTVAGSIHDFRVLSQRNLDEPQLTGQEAVRRKDIIVSYKTYS